MVDQITSERRSRNMSAIKAKDTAIEIHIRKILFSEGFRYRLHQKSLPGKPDIVLAKYKTVIFIHGCFWHRHQCHLGTLPKTNTDFWAKKFNLNTNRDLITTQSLLSLGWKVIVIWECAIKGKAKLSSEILKLRISSSIRERTEKLIKISGLKA